MTKRKLCILSLMTFLLIILSPISAPAYAAGRFETPRYDVHITVGEDNILHVEERITMNLVEESRGLLRNIPYYSEVAKVVNGKVIKEKKRVEIKNVKVDGHKFKTYKENDNLYIRIGDSKKYLTGVQQYNISYDFILGKDNDTTEDLLYFNILPAKWNSKIENSTLTITMPKSFDSSKLEFIATKQNKTDLFAVTVKGNTITATLQKPLTSNNTATAVMLHLPEGYFSKAVVVKGAETTAFFVLLGTIVFAFLAAFISHFYKKPVKVTEYLPPNDMSPAEIGHLYRTKTTNKQLVSMIIYWADKGYLTIEEKSEKDIYLHRLKKIPKSAPKYERYFFNALFDNSLIVGMKDLDWLFLDELEKETPDENVIDALDKYLAGEDLGDFLANNPNSSYYSEQDNSPWAKSTVQVQRGENGTQIISQSASVQTSVNGQPLEQKPADNASVRIADLKYNFASKIEMAGTYLETYMEKTVSIFKSKSNFIKILLCINVFLPLLIFFFYGKGEGFFPVEESVVYFVVVAPLTVAIFYLLVSRFRVNCNSNKAFSCIMILVVAAVTLIYLLRPNSADLSKVHFHIFCFSAVAFFSNTFLMFLYHKAYSEEYLELLGRIWGFKDFIEKVEKDKLEMLVEQYPHYFYHIMPYAYVLGVSKKWAKNFETIATPAPSWYYGSNLNSFNVNTFASNMNHMMSHTSHTLSSTFSSSSDGSSSDSGSYSDGGGSSSGGSGGGGGDTW